MPALAKSIIPVFLLLLSAQSRLNADTNTPTVVCLGDSITRAGFPEELAKKIPATVINAGVSGNSSRQGLARLGKDVLSHKPSAVIVLFGTNDNRQDDPKVHVPLGEYEENLVRMVTRCREAGAKVIVATMPPIDPEPYFRRHVKQAYDDAGGLEQLVAQYRERAIKAAKSAGASVVDLNRLLAADTAWRKPDGVHPTAEGNRVIAQLLAEPLKAALGSTAKSPAR